VLDHWPLIGRDQEIAEVTGLIGNNAYRGVALAGKPGVGKSRLAREAIQTAADAGWTLRRAAATATSRSIPLGAFAQWTDDFEGAQLALARKVIAALTAGTEPDRLLVFVDDAHLLDDLSALVVHQLRRHPHLHRETQQRPPAPKLAHLQRHHPHLQRYPHQRQRHLPLRHRCDRHRRPRWNRDRHVLLQGHQRQRRPHRHQRGRPGPWTTISPSKRPPCTTSTGQRLRRRRRRRHGTRAYVTNIVDDTVSVIDTATNTVVATVAVGNAPGAVAISPDGTRAYVANNQDGTVSVLILAPPVDEV
jgi:YVTN family beta-propeller protein